MFTGRFSIALLQCLFNLRCSHPWALCVQSSWWWVWAPSATNSSSAFSGSHSTTFLPPKDTMPDISNSNRRCAPMLSMMVRSPIWPSSIEGNCGWLLLVAAAHYSAIHECRTLVRNSNLLYNRPKMCDLDWSSGWDLQVPSWKKVRLLLCWMDRCSSVILLYTRSSGKQSTLHSLSSTLVTMLAIDTTSAILTEEMFGSGMVVLPTMWVQGPCLNTSAEASRTVGLSWLCAVRTRRDGVSFISFSFSSFSGMESSLDKEKLFNNSNHNPSSSYSKYDKLSTLESYSRSTHTRSANGTHLPSSSSDHTPRSERDLSSTDTPTSSTPYEMARSLQSCPSLHCQASLPFMGPPRSVLWNLRSRRASQAKQPERWVHVWLHHGFGLRERAAIAVCNCRDLSDWSVNWLPRCQVSLQARSACHFPFSSLSPTQSPVQSPPPVQFQFQLMPPALPFPHVSLLLPSSLLLLLVSLLPFLPSLLMNLLSRPSLSKSCQSLSPCCKYWL